MRINYIFYLGNHIIMQDNFIEQNFIINQNLISQNNCYIIRIYLIQILIFKLLSSNLLSFNKSNMKYNHMIFIIYNLLYIFHLNLNVIKLISQIKWIEYG